MDEHGNAGRRRSAQGRAPGHGGLSVSESSVRGARRIDEGTGDDQRKCLSLWRSELSGYLSENTTRIGLMAEAMFAR